MTPNYMDVLRDLHEHHGSSFYLEIGVETGRTLALSQCPCIGIDPDMSNLKALDYHPGTRLYQQTSDEFFEASTIPVPIDLAFIDGLHHAEQVMRDLNNILQYSAPSVVIVIDDIIPTSKEAATRTRTTESWSGDVYRVVPMIQARSDLVSVVIPANPAGLLVVRRA